LLAGLVAGDAAGGQRSGRQSAALQVRTPEGFPFDVDLRVDHSSDPVGALQLLYDLLTARQDVIDARISVRRGETAGVRARLIAAVGRASKWPRICVEAAKVALSIEDRSLALQYLALAFARSPERVPVVLGGGDFAELGAEPAFRRWVGEDLRRDVVSDVGSAAGASSPEQPELVVRHVRRLLEVGEAGEALRLLDAAPPPASSGDWLLRAAAHAALGDREAAREACRQGLRESPDDPRLRQRLEALSTGG
jgi:tetratricopeptide (TPR) repeat protein